MYPVADGHNIYPDGAASLLSVLIFEALKINIGFNDNLQGYTRRQRIQPHTSKARR